MSKAGYFVSVKYIALQEREAYLHYTIIFSKSIDCICLNLPESDIHYNLENPT